MNAFTQNAVSKTKLRLVFGTFEEHVALLRAMGDLASKDFVANELCILGARDALLATPSFANSLPEKYQEYLRLLSSVKLYPHQETGVESIVGTHGPVLEHLIQVATGEHASLHCKATLAKIVNNINQGCMILVSSIAKPRQLSHASKIMLQRSARNVQTMEVVI